MARETSKESFSGYACLLPARSTALDRAPRRRERIEQPSERPGQRTERENEAEADRKKQCPFRCDTIIAEHGDYGEVPAIPSRRSRIRMRFTPTITVNNMAASDGGSAMPWAWPTDQTTTIVSAWIRHPRARITGPLGPRRTRRASRANFASQRQYCQRASSSAIFGASNRPTAAASNSPPYTMTT